MVVTVPMVVLDKVALDKAALDKAALAVVHLYPLRQSLCLIYNPLINYMLTLLENINVGSSGKRPTSVILYCRVLMRNLTTSKRLSSYSPLALKRVRYIRVL